MEKSLKNNKIILFSFGPSLRPPPPKPPFFPLFWNYSPRVFVLLHLQLVMHIFIIIQCVFTYYIIWPLFIHCIHIYISNMTIKTKGVTFPTPYILHRPRCTSSLYTKNKIHKNFKTYVSMLSTVHPPSPMFLLHGYSRSTA
jgi:hypothetical protein